MEFRPLPCDRERTLILKGHLFRDGLTNANIFKNFYSTSAYDFLKNLPPPSLIFHLSSVRQYYEKNLKLPDSNFLFTSVTEETVLKILKNLNENTGFDNLSGRLD